MIREVSIITFNTKRRVRNWPEIIFQYGSFKVFQMSNCHYRANRARKLVPPIDRPGLRELHKDQVKLKNAFEKEQCKQRYRAFPVFNLLHPSLKHQ